MPIDAGDRLELAHCEQGIIGGAINNPQILDLIGDTLRGEHFMDEEIGKLYDGILSLHGSGVNIADQIGLNAMLQLMKIRTSITVHQLAQWARQYFDWNAKYYADIIITSWRHRQLWQLGIQLAKRFDIAAAIHPRQSDRDDIAFIETKVAALYDTRDMQSVRPAYDIAYQYLCELEEVKQANAGIMTGISSVDTIIGKTLPGEVLVVAARPGCGKTAIALQIAEHNSGHGAVFFVSLEMVDKELMSRTLCRMAGVDSKILRNAGTSKERAEAIAAIRDTMQTIRDMPLYVWSPHTATIQQIRSKAKYVKAAHGLRMIVVDYIQIIHVAGDSRRNDRHLQISEITRMLKEMAKEFDVPVVALAQLNRDASNKKPEISNLRESGSIENDADIVLMLHHERDAKGRVEKSYVIIGKHRHNDQGEIVVNWNPTFTMFEDLDAQEVARSMPNYTQEFN